MTCCEMCGKEIDYQPNAIQLDGTDDIYCFEVCDECNEVFGQDYFDPEDVDRMMGVNK